jgi:hypothetical protein
MKVYHITEAPRIEPPVGGLGNRPINRGPSVSGGGGNAPRLTSVDITDTGILDRNGNKIFKVVDQDGKELFRGNEAQANDKRDTLRRNIRTPAATRTVAPAANNRANTITPDADEVKPADNSKSNNGRTKIPFRKRLANLAKGGIWGILFSGFDQSAQLYTEFERYADSLEDFEASAKTSEDQNDLDIARVQVTDQGARFVRDMFLAAASGAITGVALTRVLLVVPGAGWIAALITGGVGWASSYALEKIAGNSAMINGISRWLFGSIEEKLLNRVVEADSNAPNSLELKQAMKQLILDDPKMIKTFKVAKKVKANNNSTTTAI